MSDNNLDNNLEKILKSDNAPEVNINARKRAVNLAMSEFKVEQQKKNQNNSQGYSFLSRLMFIANKKRGNKTMEKKRSKTFIYGGMATAMAVVLVAGVSLTQLDSAVHRNNIDIFSPEALTVLSDKALLKEKRLTESKQDNHLDKNAGRKKESEDPLSQWNRESTDRDAAGIGSISPAKEAVDEIELQASSPALLEQDIAKVQAPRMLGKAKLRANKEVASGMVLYNSPVRSIAVDDAISPPSYKDVGRDKFEDFKTNPFKLVSAEPVSTFSSDVDTASYSFIRRQINNGVLPQKDAVRVEEMINYFNYDYPVPNSRAEPFKPTVTITDSPWAEGKKLMHIGIKGYQVEAKELRSNLVFLLDVSGSMNSSDKLPLVKNSMKMLLDSLHADDTISIVTYAGSTGVVLEPTKVSQRSKIINAMNNLNAGGGTAGAAGIKLAYDVAQQNFDKGAVNRVILATDGDFNVGITNREELKDFVERKRDKGIFLSVLGFGQGNYNDHMMQVLAQNGNGVAAYIDNLNEARKVLVEEATSSLFPIAKDVKFQVEFNPDQVAEYRLVGYETRALNREDFNNDKIDAGDMGAGHSVTAIYEFVPVGSDAVSVDKLRYGKVKLEVKDSSDSGEYAFLKIRYKLPTESNSKLITTPVAANQDVGSLNLAMNGIRTEENQAAHELLINDTRFSTAVAAFGQILKGGEHTGDFTYDDVIALAQQGKGEDKFGYRAEFINMVRLAKTHSR